MAAGNTTVYDAGSLAKRMLDGCYDPFARKLYMTGIASTSKGILQHDADLPFSEAGSWKFQDLTEFNAAANGYAGGVATGYHVYFAPCESSDYTLNSTVARYAKSGDFNTGGSWEFVDTTSVVGANCAGFRGGIYDGRYIYFPPFTQTATPLGHYAARYDTQGAFDSATSWAGVDLAAVNAACTDYVGGCFDGRYVYFSPFGSSTAHGQALRIDITKAFVASNFERYDMTGINANCKGYSGCTFDGRYVYYAPTNNGSYHGYVVRYDTWGPFTEAGSWATFNLTTISSTYKGYMGICFDGRYVYLGPYVNTNQHGLLTRYDVGLPFNSSASWSVFGLTTISSTYKGYTGAFCDGRNVYLVPFYNGAAHGFAVKSSTKSGHSTTRLYGWNTTGKTAIESSTPLTQIVDAYTANVTHHAGAVDSSLAAYVLLVDRNTLYAGVGHFPALRDGAAIFAANLLDGIEGLAFQYEVLEQGICDMHLYNDKVYSPGVDEIEGAAGNYYIGQDGVWTKKQVVTSAAHVFGSCHDDLGRLYLAGSVGSAAPNGDYMWDTENEGVAVNEHATSVAGYRCFSVLALSSTDIYVTGNTAANETSGVLIYATSPLYDTQVAGVVPACRVRLVKFDGHAICADVGLESLWQLVGGVAVEFTLPFTMPSPTILSYSGYSLYNPMCPYGEYLYVLGTTGVWRSPDLVQWEKVLDTTDTYVAMTVWNNRIILADVGVRPRLHMTRQIWPF